MDHARKPKYLYAVRRKDGTVAMRVLADSAYQCPADCEPICSDDLISPLSGVRYDFEHATFVRPTRAQKAEATRVLHGKRACEDATRLAALDTLRTLVADPRIRAVVECLVTLPASDIKTILGETGASAPAGAGSVPAP